MVQISKLKFNSSNITLRQKLICFFTYLPYSGFLDLSLILTLSLSYPLLPCLVPENKT